MFCESKTLYLSVYKAVSKLFAIPKQLVFSVKTSCFKPKNNLFLLSKQN